VWLCHGWWLALLPTPGRFDHGKWTRTPTLIPRSRATWVGMPSFASAGGGGEGDHHRTRARLSRATPARTRPRVRGHTPPADPSADDLTEDPTTGLQPSPRVTRARCRGSTSACPTSSRPGSSTRPGGKGCRSTPGSCERPPSPLERTGPSRRPEPDHRARPAPGADRDPALRSPCRPRRLGTQRRSGAARAAGARTSAAQEEGTVASSRSRCGVGPWPATSWRTCAVSAGSSVPRLAWTCGANANVPIGPRSCFCQ
jgi:hypothetical protein